MREEREEVKKERKMKDQLEIRMEFPLGRRKQEIRIMQNLTGRCYCQHFNFQTGINVKSVS